MDWREDIEDELATIKRIIATFLSLADMAVRASRLPLPIRCFLVWVFSWATRSARGYAFELADELGLDPPQLANDLFRINSPDHALNLARDLRALAEFLSKAHDELAAGYRHWAGAIHRWPMQAPGVSTEVHWQSTTGFAAVVRRALGAIRGKYSQRGHARDVGQPLAATQRIGESCAAFVSRLQGTAYHPTRWWIEFADTS